MIVHVTFSHVNEMWIFVRYRNTVVSLDWIDVFLRDTVTAAWQRLSKVISLVLYHVKLRDIVTVFCNVIKHDCGTCPE